MSKKSTRRQKRRRRRRTQVSRKRLRRRTRRKRRKRTRRRKVRVQRGGGFGPLQFGRGMEPPPAMAGAIGRPPVMDERGGGASGVEWRTYGTAHFPAYLRPLTGIEWWYFAQRIAKEFYQYRVYYGTAQAFVDGLGRVHGWRNTNWGWGERRPLQGGGWGPPQPGYFFNTDVPTRGDRNTTGTHLHMVEAFTTQANYIDFTNPVASNNVGIRAVFVAKYGDDPVDWRGPGGRRRQRVTYIIDGTCLGIAKWAFESLRQDNAPLLHMAGWGPPLPAQYLRTLCVGVPNPLQPCHRALRSLQVVTGRPPGAVVQRASYWNLPPRRPPPPPHAPAGFLSAMDPRQQH